MKRNLILVCAVLAFATTAGAKPVQKNLKSKGRKAASAGQEMFYCSNAPVSKWGTYFGVMGYYDSNIEEISEVIFGTFEGSNKAQEEEPVDTFDFPILKHNPELAASSSQWKNAKAFDITTESFGKAVLYITADTFAKKKGTSVRVKFASGKDVKIPCAP